MGISGLWDSIPDAIERVPCSHLEGKVIAVDLACWVMADKSIAHSRMVSYSKDKQVQNFFVRNLFSRVVRLLELGVIPIIVTDGKAPEAKMKTMASRLGQAELKSTNRNRFAQVLKKCTDLLDALGIQWIPAPGEAEKMASTLQLAEKVNSVFTFDGDAFCFGAKSIYRTFSCDTEAEFEYVSLEKIKELYKYSRFDFIVFAVLCGCDYFPTGIKGVGPKMTTRMVLDWKTRKFNPIRRLKDVQKGRAMSMSKDEVKLKGLFKNYLDLDLDKLISEFMAKEEGSKAEVFRLHQDLLCSAPKFIAVMERLLDWTAVKSIEKLIELQLRTNKKVVGLKAVSLVRSLKGAKSHMIYFEAGETNAEVKLKTEDVLIICPALAPANVKSLPKPAMDIRRFAQVKETKRKLNSPQVKKPEKLMKHLTPQKLGDVSRQLDEEVESICDILESSSLKDDFDEDDSDQRFNLNRISNKNAEDKENSTAKKKLAQKYNFSDSD